jgi:hypothetical protein
MTTKFIDLNLTLKPKTEEEIRARLNELHEKVLNGSYASDSRIKKLRQQSPGVFKKFALAK